jgi:hypothetical protein
VWGWREIYSAYGPQIIWKHMRKYLHIFKAAKGREANAVLKGLEVVLTAHERQTLFLDLICFTFFILNVALYSVCKASARPWEGKR